MVVKGTLMLKCIMDKKNRLLAVFLLTVAFFKGLDFT
ncbi:MAG: hypothetical protein ACI8SK_000276 [Shewanella sp.]|jgi:hypothetical protein